MSGGLSPGGVAGQALEEVSAGSFEFISDEAQAKEPASEGVLRVVGFGACGACRLAVQGLRADGEAKLDVAFHLSGVECAVESAELDGVRGAFGGEGRVEVEHIM